LPKVQVDLTAFVKVLEVDTQSRLESLELIVQQIGEAVLATTETVDRLSERVDALVNQVQQQGYQIFALSDAVQTITEVQNESLQRLDRLTDTLERLVHAIEEPDLPTA
jgi:ABC-type transporter Mla subunit MlaD